MINCPDLQEDVSLWVDGELDLTRAETVKRHLECCPECAAFHRDMNAIRQGVERLEPIEPPDRLWKSIRFQLEAEGRIRSKPKESFWARAHSQEPP